VLQFNEHAFNALPIATRDSLMAEGVVQTVTEIKKPSASRVTLTLNV
jgi:hypothetical protein